MEQHPIPQQISSYEFKLVGEMTLKQFGKAAAGIILALMFKASPLVFFIKWPLVLMSAIGGLAMAFVPFQDRPLETWILAFIKSIYAPTIYVFKKKRPVNWLDIDYSKKITEDETEDEENKPVKPVKKVAEFIDSLPSVNREEKKPEEEIVEEKEEPETKKTEPKMEEKNTKKIETMQEDQEEKGPDWIEGKPELNLKKEKLEATGKALFGEIPMPDIPDLPNLIVGMVTNSKGEIVEGAIVSVEDKGGNPTRVMKTNQLGQFKTQTQLTNGEYLIVTEKEGLEFDRAAVSLNGKIVPPIKIISK